MTGSKRCAADIGWLGMDDSNGSFWDCRLPARSSPPIRGCQQPSRL